MPTLSLQDRRREAENTIARLTAQREGCIANLVRYEGRLTLARRKLERLKRANRKALEKMEAAKPQPLDRETVEAVTTAIGHAPLNPVKPDDDGLEIPGFLRRAGSIGGMTPADLDALEKIERANAEQKKAKAQANAERRKVRQEKLQAKLTGETRKMPLSGRAAMEKIRAG
jgi:hypothetical protein